MAQDDPFARDLGYLAKFFDSLRTHAGTLDSVAAQRLLSLLDEEAARWDEIKRLLAGAGPQEPAGKSNPGPAPQARPVASGLTVGSLLGQR